MEITFRIDPSYASPTEMVSLINAMQGLAATMGATMTNPAGMSVRASPSDSGGRSQAAQQQAPAVTPAARVEDALEAAIGPFENQVNAAAPGLPSDDAIRRTAEKIDAASRACVGEELRFAKLLFGRVANHAFSPRTSDSVLAWVDVLARISVEQLRETVRNQLTQRALKTMTKPARSSAGQASMIQPAICFAAMIKFTMIKMDGTCDTIAALLQQTKTTAAAILVLKQVLRICPTQLASGASHAKMEKLLAAVQKVSLQKVEGAGAILAKLRETCGAVGGGGGGGGGGGATFNERQPHTLVHQVAFAKAQGKRIHALAVLGDELFSCGQDGTVAAWNVGGGIASAAFGQLSSQPVDVSGGDMHVPGAIAAIHGTRRLVVATFGEKPREGVQVRCLFLFVFISFVCSFFVCSLFLFFAHPPCPADSPPRALPRVLARERRGGYRVASRGW